MPILLVNHTATIEININANLQHIIGKGSFDVTIHTENDIADVSVDFVWILFKRRDGQINNNFRLDWREVTPTVSSAEELRDLILGWNIPPVIVTSSALPAGAATEAKQLKDYLIEVRRGNIPGVSLLHKFGRNPAVPSGSWAFINLLGLTTFPITTPTTVRIKAGGNAADTSDGAGAREVTVRGIVATTFAEETETIATAGASASASTTKEWWRVHRIYVSSVGTYGVANTGGVVIEKTAGGDIISLLPDEGQSQTAIYTIPSGKTGYLLSIHAFVDAGSNKIANIRCFTREDIDVVTAPMKPKRLKLFWDGVVGAMSYRSYSPELMLNEKTDIWFEAYGDGAVSQVSLDFEILLIDN